MRDAESSSTRSFLAALLLVSFGLNWIWEMMQMTTYIEMKGRSWRETALVCTLASFGDAVITFLIFAVGALVTRRVRWIAAYGWKAYAGAALGGAMSAMVIEWLAHKTGYWTYTSRMPTVPVIGTGLWPFLQLTLLVPLALWLAGLWSRRGAG